MLSQFFINRPKFALVISILIVIVGGISIPQLPIESMPDITPPTIKVSTTYPGANANTVLESVAAPIEEQVNGVENMIYMDSKSDSEGQFNLTVSFEIGSDVDMAQVMTKNRVAVAEPLCRLERPVHRRSQAGIELVHSRALEHDQAVGPLDGPPRLGAGSQIAVEVGAGQRHHQRQVGTEPLESLDRRVAAPRVKRQQQVAALAVPLLPHVDPVAEPAQDPRPADGGDPVAGAVVDQLVALEIERLGAVDRLNTSVFITRKSLRQVLGGLVKRPRASAVRSPPPETDPDRDHVGQRKALLNPTLAHRLLPAREGVQQHKGRDRADADQPDPLQRARHAAHLFQRFNQVGVTVLIASHDVDIIRQMGELPIADTEDYKKAIVKYRKKKSLIIVLQRQDQLYNITVKL